MSITAAYGHEYEIDGMSYITNSGHLLKKYTKMISLHTIPVHFLST